jgi:hypothetical protein
MPYSLVPFTQDYLEPAVALFIDTCSYFRPYLYASMRYIDTTLPIPAREEP